MSKWRSILGCGAAMVALSAAAHGSAQDGGGAMARVWIGDMPAPNWTDPSRADAYVGRAPRDPAETRRLESLMDHVLANYPESGRVRGLQAVEGHAFQPVQDPPGALVVPILRLNDVSFAFGAACGLARDSQDFITAPATWFDAPAQASTPDLAPELSLASAIGLRQLYVFCRDMPGGYASTADSRDFTASELAMNGLGSGLGFYALAGAPMWGGGTWGLDGVQRLLAAGGASSFSVGADMSDATALARRYGTLRLVDEPLFSMHDEQVVDAGFWASAGAGHDWAFLPRLFSAPPSGPEAQDARRWLDEALKGAVDPELGLAHLLPVLNWTGLTGYGLIQPGQGDGLFSRASWQGAMVRRNGSPGCVPVELSLSRPFVELTLELEAAGANCLAVRWSGATRDPELPPSFTVVADAGVDAEALDGLHLSADQNWTDQLTIESGDRAERFERNHAAPINRAGLIVEDVQSRRAVKSWEVVFRPDVAFADETMTVVLTSLHPDGEDRTRPMSLRLTVGPGAHEARQNLTAATVPVEGDPCTGQQQFTPNVARAYSIPVNNFHVAAIDPEDFSINGFFHAAGGPGLQARLVDCTRIQMALGVQGPGVVGQAFRGAENADSPASVCAGSAAELTGLGAQALAGVTGANLSNMAGMERLQPRQIEFGLTARSPITGPGTYPADATAAYQDLRMEERDLQLPTSNYGEGTITVEHAGPGRLRVRYEARFEPQQCSAYLAGTISGTLETVTALPMVGMSRRAFVAPRPIDMFGERLWMQMPVAARREMRNQPRRTTPDAAQSPGAGGPGGRVGELRDPTQCTLSDEDVRRILRRYASQMPAQIRAQFLADVEADPDAARHMACIFQDAM